DKITFEEMLELASQGSKVLQTRSVEFAGKYKVKLRVLSSFAEKGDGTLITFEEDSKDDHMEQPLISGIAFNRDEAKVMVLGVPDTPGIAYQILGPIADANIDVDVIIQNQGAKTTDFTFTVHKNEMGKALEILNTQVQPNIHAREIIGDDNVAKVSAVGVGMRSHVGIASQMFRTLSEEGINIQMISTSEIKIAVVIEEKYMELAVHALHKAFKLEET
ncbi:MAG: aspartate kinase, partial [Methylophilaceae bacterium]